LSSNRGHKDPRTGDARLAMAYFGIHGDMVAPIHSVCPYRESHVLEISAREICRASCETYQRHYDTEATLWWVGSTIVLESSVDSSEIRNVLAAQYATRAGRRTAERPNLPDVAADRPRLFSPIASEPWNVGIPPTRAGKMPAHPGSKHGTPHRITSRRP
jgi:hypothetical protein